jgi:hypothetical protein
VKEFFGSSYTLTLQKPSKMWIVKREEEGEAGERGVGGWSKEKGKRGLTVGGIRDTLVNAR